MADKEEHFKYFIVQQSSHYIMTAKSKGSKGKVKKKSRGGKKPPSKSRAEE